MVEQRIKYWEYCYCGKKKQDHDPVTLRRYEGTALMCPVFTSIAPQDAELAGKEPKVC